MTDDPITSGVSLPYSDLHGDYSQTMDSSSTLGSLSFCWTSKSGNNGSASESHAFEPEAQCLLSQIDLGQSGGHDEERLLSTRVSTVPVVGLHTQIPQPAVADS